MILYITITIQSVTLKTLQREKFEYFFDKSVQNILELKPIFLEI